MESSFADDSVDDDDNDNKIVSRKWGDDDSSDFAVPIKKSGALDSEFAKMLGLDDDINPPSSFEDELGSTPADTFSAQKADSPKAESEDDTPSFKYTPTVRGGPKMARQDKSSSDLFSDDSGVKFFDVQDTTDSQKPATGGGLSASFFSDEGGGGTRGDSLSFLSSTSTSGRRGGRRGGRHVGDDDDGGGSGLSGPAVADPFASKSSDLFPTAKASGVTSLDSLFGSNTASKAAADPFAAKTTTSVDPPVSSSTVGARARRATPTDEADEHLPAYSKPSTSKKTPLFDDSDNAPSVQDDLLAELFPVERKTESARREWSPQQKDDSRSRDGRFGSKSDRPAFDDENGTRDNSAAAPSAKSDLLAELFPKDTVNDSRDRNVNKPTPATQQRVLDDQPTPTGRQLGSTTTEDALPPTQTPKPITAVKAATKPSIPDNSSSSARDSLLMDLLGDLSPPKPIRSAKVESESASTDLPSSSPVPSRRGSAASSPTRQTNEQESNDQRLLTSLSSLKLKDESTTPPGRPSLPSKLAISTSSPGHSIEKPPQPVSSSTGDYELSPPSPGRARTLTVASPSSIKESEFEQSKDSLLEELLSPRSPIQVGAANSPSGYSQSFDDEKSDMVSESVQSSPSRSPRRRRESFATQSSPISEHTAGNQPLAKVAEESEVTQDDQSASQRTDVSGHGVHVLHQDMIQVQRVPAAPVQAQHSRPQPSTSDLSRKSTTADQTSEQPSRIIVDEAGWKEREEAVRAEATKLADGSWKLREERLIAEAAATRAKLTENHNAELSKLREEMSTIRSQLVEERQRVESITIQLEVATGQHITCDQDKQTLRQQLSAVQSEKQTAQRDLASLQAVHAQCSIEASLVRNEMEGAQIQLKSVDDQKRQLVRELTQEKREHQAVRLKLEQREREFEQEYELERHREKLQMEKLFQQLHTALAQLHFVHGQVSDEQQTRNEVENSTRLRLISSLESSSRGFARQSEQECHRIEGVLGSLETTLRHYRQEHLEEKERLRQEQMRLDMLAAHFQAQSNILHERADANTQMLAKSLAASLQDVRTGEARLATRRQQFEEAERALFDERAIFAAYREQEVAKHAHEEQTLQQQRVEIEARWRDLNDDRADLEAVIAAHEDDFQQLEQQRRELEIEKQRIEARAAEITELAQRFEQFTSQLVAREHEVDMQKKVLSDRHNDVAARERALSTERHTLEEREVRLHRQLRQMEKARGRLNEQRKEHLLSSLPSANAGNSGVVKRRSGDADPTTLMARGGRGSRVQPVAGHDRLARRSNDGTPLSYYRDLARADNQSEHVAPATGVAGLFDLQMRDPSGLSPALRKMVEENWKRREWQLGQSDASILKERMWISCAGLDTTPSGLDDSDVETDDAWRRYDRGTSSHSKGTARSGSTLDQGKPPSTPGQMKMPPPPPPPPPLGVKRTDTGVSSRLADVRIDL